jgi:hypothetical protein
LLLYLWTGNKLGKGTKERRNKGREGRKEGRNKGRTQWLGEGEEETIIINPS